MKKIIVITCIISINTYSDVKTKTIKPYKPINMSSYNYSYSYSKTSNRKSYVNKYFALKKEHKKVVKLLDNAKKELQRMHYELYKLRKKVEYNKMRINKIVNKKNERKRKEAIKKMRETWKSN